MKLTNTILVGTEIVVLLDARTEAIISTIHNVDGFGARRPDQKIQTDMPKRNVDSP
jgi:hypothetical protein